MAKDQGLGRKKKFTKIYYLLLVPAIAIGLLAIPWLTSANQTAIDIKSFPEFIPDEQSVIEEGMELSADNYLPLATTEVESGQELDLASLPGTVKAEILVGAESEEGQVALATDIADIAAEWDADGLDLQKPGLYKLSLKLPGDYSYNGVLPYITVEVKAAEASLPDEQDTGDESEGTMTEQAGDDSAQLPEPKEPQDELPQMDSDAEPTPEPEPTEPQAPAQDLDLEQQDAPLGAVASKEVQQFCGIYPSGDVAAIYNITVGETNGFSPRGNITAYMTDGSLVDIPIKWTGNYSLSAPGTYRITMAIEGDYVWNGPEMVAEIIVRDNEDGR